MSSLTLVTEPAVEPLTDAEIWAHLRVPLLGSPAAPNDQSLIAIYAKAARRRIDGKDGWLGRAIVTQTWDMKLDGFPGCGLGGGYDRRDAIRVPLPPLQSVTSITYTDENGDAQTLSADLYTVDISCVPAIIIPAYGQVWPSTLDTINTVTVRFMAGYVPSADSPADYRANVPAEIKAALLLMTGHLYNHREDVQPGQMFDLPQASYDLLAPYRIWTSF